jgi:hypothetical protein
MPGAAEQNSILQELEQLTTHPWAGPKDLPQAIRSLASAMQCDDVPTMESYKPVFEALRDLVNNLILQRAGSAQKQFKELWQRACNPLKMCPLEDTQPLAKAVDAWFNEHLAQIIRIRDFGVRTLVEHGFPVSNAPLLDRDLEELEKLRESISASWPQPDQLLPPANREMIARSRAERALQEGESFEQMLQRVAAPRAQTTQGRS